MFSCSNAWQYLSSCNSQREVSLPHKRKPICPEVGRFCSRDPIGYEGSQWNLYAYVRENPVRYTEPSGEKILCAAISVFGGKYLCGSGQYLLCRDDCGTLCAFVLCAAEVLGMAAAWALELQVRAVVCHPLAA